MYPRPSYIITAVLELYFPPMRIAVFADVHGNIHALQAALEDIAKQDVEQIVLAGDLLNGLPSSKQCLDLINENNILFLRGNHERYVYDYGTDRAPDSWSGENFAPVRWVREHLTTSDIDQLKSLPMYVQYDDLLITHAAPKDDYFSLKDKTPASEIEAAFQGFSENYILRGHHHRWIERYWSDRYLLSVSALGLPMEGVRETPYVIAEKRTNGWQFQKYFVEYDFKAAVRSFADSGYLDYTPMAYLSREELIRAESVVYSFILDWRAQQNGGINLGDAIRSYLKKN